MPAPSAPRRAVVTDLCRIPAPGAAATFRRPREADRSGVLEGLISWAAPVMEFLLSIVCTPPKRKSELLCSTAENTYSHGVEKVWPVCGIGQESTSLVCCIDCGRSILRDRGCTLCKQRGMHSRRSVVVPRRRFVTGNLGRCARRRMPRLSGKEFVHRAEHPAVRRIYHDLWRRPGSVPWAEAASAGVAPWDRRRHNHNRCWRVSAWARFWRASSRERGSVLRFRSETELTEESRECGACLRSLFAMSVAISAAA